MSSDNQHKTEKFTSFSKNLLTYGLQKYFEGLPLHPQFAQTTVRA
jgi:hypothetical protein